MTLGTIFLFCLLLLFLSLVIGSILFLSAGELIGGLSMGAGAFALLFLVAGVTLFMSLKIEAPVNNHPLPIGEQPQSHPQPIFSHQEINPQEFPQIAVAPETMPQEAKPVSQLNSDETTGSSNQQTELPPWITASEEQVNRQRVQEYLARDLAIPETIVIQTGLWSSQAEVEDELQQLAKKLAIARGQQLLSQNFEARSIADLIQTEPWNLSRTHYRAEQRELTPGVKSEMYQAWAELDLRTSQYAKFRPMLREAEVKTRLTYVTVGLAGVLLTLAMGIIYVDRKPGK